MHFKHRLRDATCAGLAAFVAVILLSYLKSWGHFMVLSAPLGATLVLLLLLPSAPLSRPKNVILGHLLTTGVAVIGMALIHDPMLGLATCFGLGITLMVLTDTLHPPAGANPILIYLSGAHLPPLDFMVSTLVGSLFMVGFASLYHYIFTHRRYPFGPKASKAAEQAPATPSTTATAECAARKSS
ncbi:CBS-domain-containing membrane protein [Oceanisphaera litoralis]|uniref:HPP family protein n=1 Tax=Oceanisphaera litoralis TaxID=225144 RepID=UPI00195640DE|nr:HPP family protein [Oceanisphaera litoralis]MBM7455015.1 CBS-domain-containing membrane protein [Oceanisphaera litoralis]